MRKEQTYTAWTIGCDSPEASQALQGWLAKQIDLDRIMIDTVIQYPNGVEQTQTVPHRLGDYFSAIEILPAVPSNPATFRLVFARLPKAGRFWKDLMVRILGEVEAAPEKPSIMLDYKGDEKPSPSPATK